MDVAARPLLNALVRVEDISILLETCSIEPSCIGEFPLLELSPNTSFFEIKILGGKFVNSEPRNVS